MAFRPTNVMEQGAVLGIESTAHTFSIGWVDQKGVPRRSVSSAVRPLEGGIHPREAADHHASVAGKLLEELHEGSEPIDEPIVAIAFSQGPGMAPCLRVGAMVSRALSSELGVPLIGVNHCVAHIEIGRRLCNVQDPVLLYVSGGNTQVIARLSGRYRVLGETLDIGIGNMLDKFARNQGIPFPGGPKIETLADAWTSNNPEADISDFELPYPVHGMDLAFSGIMTSAERLLSMGRPLEGVAWSIQEHAFAACIEVAERAMAHAGKANLLLGGGVACNARLREMADQMALERGGTAHAPPKQYCVDNGTMIALLGQRHLEYGETTPILSSAIIQELRTDETPLPWPIEAV